MFPTISHIQAHLSYLCLPPSSVARAAPSRRRFVPPLPFLAPFPSPFPPLPHLTYLKTPHLERANHKNMDKYRPRLLFFSPSSLLQSRTHAWSLPTPSPSPDPSPDPSTSRSRSFSCPPVYARRTAHLYAATTDASLHIVSWPPLKRASRGAHVLRPPCVVALPAPARALAPTRLPQGPVSVLCADHTLHLVDADGIVLSSSNVPIPNHLNDDDDNDNDDDIELLYAASPRTTGALVVVNTRGHAHVYTWGHNHHHHHTSSTSTSASSPYRVVTRSVSLRPPSREDRVASVALQHADRFGVLWSSGVLTVVQISPSPSPSSPASGTPSSSSSLAIFATFAVLMERRVVGIQPRGCRAAKANPHEPTARKATAKATTKRGRTPSKKVNQGRVDGNDVDSSSSRVVQTHRDDRGLLGVTRRGHWVLLGTVEDQRVGGTVGAPVFVLIDPVHASVHGVYPVDTQMDPTEPGSRPGFGFGSGSGPGTIITAGHVWDADDDEINDDDDDDDDDYGTGDPEVGLLVALGPVVSTANLAAYPTTTAGALRAHRAQGGRSVEASVRPQVLQPVDRDRDRDDGAGDPYDSRGDLPPTPGPEPGHMVVVPAKVQWNTKDDHSFSGTTSGSDTIIPPAATAITKIPTGSFPLALARMKELPAGFAKAYGAIYTATSPLDITSAVETYLRRHVEHNLPVSAPSAAALLTYLAGHQPEGHDALTLLCRHLPRRGGGHPVGAAAALVAHLVSRAADGPSITTATTTAAQMMEKKKEKKKETEKNKIKSSMTKKSPSSPPPSLSLSSSDIATSDSPWLSLASLLCATAGGDVADVRAVLRLVLGRRDKLPPSWRTATSLRDAARLEVAAGVIAEAERASVLGRDDGRAWATAAVAGLVATKGGTDRDLVLHALLAQGWAAPVVFRAVEGLGWTEVVGLLRYLGKWLRAYRRHPLLHEAEGQVEISYGDVLPVPVCHVGLRVVTTWAGAVLDAHAARLMLHGARTGREEGEEGRKKNRDHAHVRVRDSVAALRKEVALMVGEMKEMMAFGGMLAHIRDAAPLPRAGGDTLAAMYHIEAFSVDVE